MSLDFFFHESVWLFTAAIGVVLALGVLETLGLLLGHGGIFGWFDHDLDFDHDVDLDHDFQVGGHGGVLAWLHVGKVPLTILLILFLSAFALCGFLAQILSLELMGQFLPLPLAAVGAFSVAVPTVRIVGGWIARIIPKDQTSAVSPDELVGRLAVITTGTARAGFAAEARVKDRFGTTHYVMVEPENSDEEFPSRTEVLLKRRIGGRRFQATAKPEATPENT